MTEITAGIIEIIRITVTLTETIAMDVMTEIILEMEMTEITTEIILEMEMAETTIETISEMEMIETTTEIILEMEMTDVISERMTEMKHLQSQFRIKTEKRGKIKYVRTNRSVIKRITKMAAEEERMARRMILLSQ